MREGSQFLILSFRDALLVVKQYKVPWKMIWTPKEHGLKRRLKKELRSMNLITWMTILDSLN